MAAHEAQTPREGSVASILLASVASSAVREDKEGQGSGGDERQQCSTRQACSEAGATSPQSSVGAAALWAARDPSAGSSFSVDPGSVSSRGTNKSDGEQGKEDGDGDSRLQHTNRPAQGGVPMTSSQASVGIEEVSASSWTAVEASPASAHYRGPREWASPVKRASSCQAVSQSPSRWASNP